MADIEWFRQLLRGSLDSEEHDPTPLLKWLEGKRSVAKFSARLIDISEIRAWSVEEKTGNIHHESRAFFSIQGVRVTSIGLREVNEWDQPIFTQKEGGILGLICKQDDRQILFLLNAKAEPGNIGPLQFAPTLQATWSNLNRAHSGKRPQLAEIILGEVESRLVYRSSHNEEGGRFWRKSNSNEIHLVDPNETPLYYDPDQFVWASLSQIKAMMLVDNVVNPFVKTIIAPL